VTSGSVTTTTTFSYEGLTLLSLAAEATGGEAWSLAYLYTADGRPYAAIYSDETTAVPFSMLTTDRGDVVALLDSSGETFASYRYDQWGRPLSTQTAATGKVGAYLAATIASRQVLRYAGYAWDAESSLYYCSARYYDPATMQFLTKDIAEADAEESPYQYCGGDPVGTVDPSGEWAQTIWFKRVQGYEIHSWLMRQALYQALTYLVSDAAATGVWGYCATRFQANLTSKAAAGLVDKFMTGLSWLPAVDRAVARVTTPIAKYGAWYARRPYLEMWLYRETTKRAVFADISWWDLRKAYRPSSGHRRMIRYRKQVATDRQVSEGIRTLMYLQGAQ
jgi:RHS repeat-associated protein